MNIIRVDSNVIHEGERVFRDYIAGMACGPGSDEYVWAMSRETGVKTLIGVILGCIDLGLQREEQILDAAARASRCRVSTVEAMLMQLAGNDPTWCFWSNDAGSYERLPGPGFSPSYPKLLLAAQ